MDTQLLIAALRARYRVFLIILGTTFVVAALVTLLMPRTYVATVSLLVDRKDGQTMNPDGYAVPERERTGYMQTQLDILTSHEVARRVVADLGLATQPGWRAAFENEANGKGNIEDWIGDQLLEKLKVEISQSSVVQAKYSSTDPKFAALVANAFGKAYTATVLALRVEPSRLTAVWFDDQLKGLRNIVEQTQARLADYEQANGIVSSDERNDLESARLGELSAALVKAQDETFTASSRQQQARGFLADGASPENLPDVIGNPFIQGLKSDLLRGEARLEQLSTQYGSRHPLYQQQASENQALRAKINGEIKRIVEGLDNAARQARQREQSLYAAMTAQRQHVLDLKRQRQQLAVLTRDVDSAQRAYDTAMQRFMASKVESAASLTNVATLSPAVVPLKPWRPRVGLNLGVALFIGSMLGLVVVYLMELMDRRVRSLADIGELRIPLLAELDTWHPARERLLAAPGIGGVLPGPA